MGITDKIIKKISPTTARKRENQLRQLEIQQKQLDLKSNQLDFINSGYSNSGASKRNKSMVAWDDHGGSVEEDVHDNLEILRNRSRELYMGSPIATGAIKAMRTNVIGAGLRLKSQVDHTTLKISREQARELERHIEKEFAIWAESQQCDISCLDNFYELQQLAFMNWLISGDVVATLPVTKRKNTLYDLRINLIEADRISTPWDKAVLNSKISGGVEVNEMGEVTAYYISDKHPLAKTSYQQMSWTRVDAFGKRTGRRNVIHMMNRERIGQRRGVPFIAPVIESLKQLERYTEAELMAAVISGFLTVFLEKDSAKEGGLWQKENGDSDYEGDSADSYLQLGPGAILELGEGEKANVVNPGRPNTAFDGFVSAIIRQIGTALELPYELLTKHFTSSFSASRGALLEAHKSFRMHRTWMANDFCQPIFEEWFTESVGKGRISAPGFFTDPAIYRAYTGAEWNGPAQGLLSPTQEVSAAVARVRNGFSTRDRESMEMNGTSFHENAEQLKREEIIMKEVLGNEPEESDT